MDKRLDVTASYPLGGIVFNISKGTTKNEIIAVEGVDEVTMRMQTINFSAGPTNALEFGTLMLGLPRLDALLVAYQREIGQVPELVEMV